MRRPEGCGRAESHREALGTAFGHQLAGSTESALGTELMRARAWPCTGEFSIVYVKLTTASSLAS